MGDGWRKKNLWRREDVTILLGNEALVEFAPTEIGGTDVYVIGRMRHMIDSALITRQDASFFNYFNAIPCNRNKA